MKLTIDDREILVEGAPTLLGAARCAGIPIPSLCDRPDLEPFAGCRLCLVEISGRNDFAPACATPAAEGMVVRTRTPELVSLRKRSSSSSWPNIPTPASSARRKRPATTSSPRSARSARSPAASSAP